MVSQSIIQYSSMIKVHLRSLKSKNVYDLFIIKFHKSSVALNAKYFISVKNWLITFKLHKIVMALTFLFKNDLFVDKKYIILSIKIFFILFIFRCIVYSVGHVIYFIVTLFP